jgi:hypothetical protein
MRGMSNAQSTIRPKLPRRAPPLQAVVRLPSPAAPALKKQVYDTGAEAPSISRMALLTV